MSNREETGVFELRLSEGKHEIAYLRFPNRPKGEIVRVSKSIRLHDLIGKYKGPDIMLDFDQEEFLIGIEIITDTYEEDEEDNLHDH